MSLLRNIWAEDRLWLVVAGMDFGWAWDFFKEGANARGAVQAGIGFFLLIAVWDLPSLSRKGKVR